MINKNNKRGIFILLLLVFLLPFATGSVLSINYPVEPQAPNLPQKTQESTEKTQSKPSYLGKSSGKDKNKNEPFHEYRVRAILQSGDELLGFIYLPQTFTFAHHKGGFDYTKTIRTEQLKSVYFRDYQEKILEKSANKTVIGFKPTKVHVRLRNGDEYEPFQMISFFNNLTIKTRFGQTQLFTEFGDTWDTKSGWSEVLSKDRLYHKTKAHPKSVVQYIFESKSGEPDNF